MNIRETAEYKEFIKVFPKKFQVANVAEAVLILCSYAFNTGSQTRRDYYAGGKIILELLGITQEDLFSEARLQELIGHKYDVRQYVSDLFDYETDEFWGKYLATEDEKERKLWTEIQSLGISYFWE